MNKYLSEYKDKFNLYKRIKMINPNYKLMLNHKTHRFEIHDFSCCFGSLCLSIGLLDLDSRIIKRLFESKRENMKALFLKIERENEMLREKNRNLAIEQGADLSREIIEYAQRRQRDLSSDEIHNLIQKMEIN